MSWWPELKGLVGADPARGSLVRVISLREVFDVAGGGSPLKSVCDWISWLLGLGVSVWALYRLVPRLGRVLAEIKEENP